MGCREQVHSSIEKNVPEQQVEHPNALSTEIESSLKQDDSIEEVEESPSSVEDHEMNEYTILDDVYQQVVNDSIREYQIAKKHGDLVDICVQAGMVAAAQLQAQNEQGYKQWKEIETIDCENYENDFMDDFENNEL